MFGSIGRSQHAQAVSFFGAQNSPKHVPAQTLSGDTVVISEDGRFAFEKYWMKANIEGYTLVKRF